ncbi:MAG: cobalt-precorrin-6A reductase [Rhodospirillales bacterium]|nr:cobalt-precorrin-6A reductase [Rhodospirillales bacterium]
MLRILILGGTTEAVALAERLISERLDIDVVTSLAGVTRAPGQVPGTVRRGGFGGVEGLADYLRAERFAALIDATHPFASVMASHAADAASQAVVPRIKLVRPMWQETADDRWIAVRDAPDAARALGDLAPSAAFVTLGRRDLDAFSDLRGIRLLVRMIEPPDAPLPHGDLLLDRGPFTAEGETTLLRENGIGALVTKASGGAANEAKILSARSLGLPVVMVARPAMPEGQVAGSVEEVMAWLADQA